MKYKIEIEYRPEVNMWAAYAFKKGGDNYEPIYCVHTYAGTPEGVEGKIIDIVKKLPSLGQKITKEIEI